MDIKRVTAAILKAVQSWVEPAVQDLSARMEAMSARIDNLPKADPAEISATVREQVVAALATLPQGEKVEPAQIRSWLEEFVSARMASMPAPKDGKDADPHLIASMIDARMAALPTPRDGRDADEAAIIAHVDAQIAARVSAIPAGKDGKDAEPIPRDTLALMIREVVDEALAKRPAPRDGKDADLAAVSTLIDARLAAMPAPRDGKDAEPIHPDTLRLMILSCAREVVAEMPRPKDGEPGPQGAPGRDVDMTYVETRLSHAEKSVTMELEGLLDELSSGLGDLGPTLTQRSNASPVSVVVNVPIEDLKIANVQATVPGMREMGEAVERLDATMKRPMRPIFNERGELVGGEREPG